MKIVSITTIKNEADIIESFVRYHLNIFDQMIILNNGSTDHTNHILESLCDENLPLIIIDDQDKYFEPFIKYNFLLKKAFEEYGADVVCALDVDEFLISNNGNPRKFIEKIKFNSYLKVKWRTYIPTVNDDENIKFVPSRIKYIRDESIETFFKVILTKNLFFNYNVKLEMGNHDLMFDSKFEDKINCITPQNLNIAHFPLRSINQTVSKILVSYPNTLSRKEYNSNMSHHYPKIFNKIKLNQNINMDDISAFAKEYSLRNYQKEELNSDNISLLFKPIDLSFCPEIKIKYPYEISPLQNVLENYVYFAREINKFKNELEKYENEITILNNKISNFSRVCTGLDEEIKDLRGLTDKYAEFLVMKDNQIDRVNKNFNQLETEIDAYKLFKSQYQIMLKELDTLKFSVKTLESLLNVKTIEINYLKNNSKISKKINYFLSIIYLILKSSFSEISINIKLFKFLKNCKLFDEGYYLSKYPEIIDTFCCENFSPELHYVCFGFNENKKFNDHIDFYSSKIRLYDELKRINMYND